MGFFFNLKFYDQVTCVTYNNTTCDLVLIKLGNNCQYLENIGNIFINIFRHSNARENIQFYKEQTENSVFIMLKVVLSLFSNLQYATEMSKRLQIA